MPAPRCTEVSLDAAPPEVREAAKRHLGEPGLHRVATRAGTYWLVCLGAQPTAGHRLTLGGVERAGERWSVRIRHEPPAPGAAHAQVITYPHLLFHVDQDEVDVLLEEPAGTRRLSPAPVGDGEADNA